MPGRDPEKRRRGDSERRHRRVEERIALGLCVRCARVAPVEGGRTCEGCRARRRAADRLRAARRRDAGITRLRDPEARKGEYRRARQRAGDRLARGLCGKCGRFPHEPDRRLCKTCGKKRRAAERERYRRARQAGLKYGRKSPHGKRRQARIRSRKRRQARRDANVCVRCARHRPVPGGASCEDCLIARRAAENAIYSARRSAGRCVRCNTTTFEGVPLCGPCTVIDARRQPGRNAAARRRYRQRLSRQICTHCGQAPSFGASRCERCARKAYARSEHVRGLPVYGSEFTVFHAGTRELLGVFEHWEDVVLCLSFAGLSFDEVEVLQAHAPMRAMLTGFS